MHGAKLTCSGSSNATRTHFPSFIMSASDTDQPSADVGASSPGVIATAAWVRRRILLDDASEDEAKLRTLLLPGVGDERIRELGVALYGFRGLRVVDLSRNLLVSASGLERCAVLEKLSLYYNAIDSLAGLDPLRHNAHLKELDVRLNPLTKRQKDVRLRVIARLTVLVSLDDRSVREAERRQAAQQFADAQGEPLPPMPASPVHTSSSAPSPAERPSTAAVASRSAIPAPGALRNALAAASGARRVLDVHSAHASGGSALAAATNTTPALAPAAASAAAAAPDLAPAGLAPAPDANESALLAPLLEALAAAGLLHTQATRRAAEQALRGPVAGVLANAQAAAAHWRAAHELSASEARRVQQAHDATERLRAEAESALAAERSRAQAASREAGLLAEAVAAAHGAMAMLREAHDSLLSNNERLLAEIDALQARHDAQAAQWNRNFEAVGAHYEALLAQRAGPGQ